MSKQDSIDGEISETICKQKHNEAKHYKSKITNNEEEN